jgi:RimJ/RimL family protein N-acetyltransferase
MPFDPQPTLTGQLLTLRPLRETDRGALFTVASDPLIWEQHPDKTRSTPEGFGNFFRDAMASGGALLVLDAETGEVLGSTRFHGYSPTAGEVEIGWTFLARRCWGGRYNGEMKRLMLTHAFQTVTRVVFLIGPHNLRSQRAVQKLGATRVGTRRNDRGQESVVYALERDVWERRAE